MQISLRPGQRIYINGSVIRVDRKVTLELLNDATFLLDSHVLQEDETTTPLRQLYFVVQTILIDPTAAPKARAMFSHMCDATCKAFENETLRSELKKVSALVEDDRAFEALRALRQLFPAEASYLLSAEQQSRAA